MKIKPNKTLPVNQSSLIISFGTILVSKKKSPTKNATK